MDTIFLDFAKAFDTIPHQQLLRKLRPFGMNNEVVAWISALLSGRKQSVLLTAVFSNCNDL